MNLLKPVVCASSNLPTLSADSTYAELVSLALTGNDSAFAHIMRRHNRMLFRTARSISKSDDDTQDALQDAYLHAWRGLASFRADARLSTWLVGIVVNEALGRLREQEGVVDLAGARLVAPRVVHQLDVAFTVLARPADGAAPRPA